MSGSLQPVYTSEGSKLSVEGRHNADLEWISELRINGNALVIHVDVFNCTIISKILFLIEI